MSREQTKAAHYIQLLDEARCQGNWDAVPELVRKVNKHAPERKCLTLTAEAEHATTQYVRSRPKSSRPGTARPSTATSSEAPGISKYIPLLLEAVENERTHVEDEFQAAVCLGWIHWQIGEPGLAASRLPRSIESEFSQLDGTSKQSAEWTRVCALKASYIKGSSQGRAGAVAEALETFDSALPILSTVSVTQQGKELRWWSELYLTGFCLLSSLAIKSKISALLQTEVLSAFRAWAKFWDVQTPAPTGGWAEQAEVPRRGVWKEYYIALSGLLQHDLPFPTTALTIAHAQTSTRLQQRAELKRIEAKYEALLLNEVQFPKAEESSEEVEAFVEVVMQNWRILCGSSWKEHDLGEGGSEAVSRGVLDILYRAATKTFHSTAILRHLFTVHLAVAEFELALKSFDTYLEIVKKGKARVEKTGVPEPSLDDDEIVLRTASECIRALCRYGSYEGVEKAKEVGDYFETWLTKHDIGKENGPGEEILNGGSTSPSATISPTIYALAWRCIGIGHAQWARMTFDATIRPDLQTQAVACLRKALLPEYESSSDPETLFALGTVLAERRELGSAIEAVKLGLLQPYPPLTTSITQGLGPRPGNFARERSLIPLWHLMALLLSSRQEFVTAARSCEGAFEQFQDAKTLFGDEDLNSSFRSDHLNEKSTIGAQGVVDDMDDFEKESVLEVKMTQLALIEVLEGPEVAVNASDELLSLYARLFGDPQKQSVKSVASSTNLPPKSSAGTIRSIKGSIFGRSGRSSRRPASLAPTVEESSNVARPQTVQTVAPIIEVTGEGELPTRTPSTKGEKLQKRADSTSRKKATAARPRSTSAGRRKLNSTSVSSRTGDSDKTLDASTDAPVQAVSKDGSALSESKPLPPKSQQMSHKESSLKPAHPNPAIAQDNRLPNTPYSSSTNPVTRFPKDQEKRRRVSILVKVWLLISGFYRRASMFEDARGAIEEAQVLVKTVEEEIQKDTSGSVSLDHAGWGGRKCVGELWGDIYSERGYLAVAEGAPHPALYYFECALTHFADHPSATVGLSNLLLDIYTEELLPLPEIPPLVQPHLFSTPIAPTTIDVSSTLVSTSNTAAPSTSHGPLGLPTASTAKPHAQCPPTPSTESSAPHESSTALLSRLAARDRAYGLLSGLTKLGTGWNYSEAWFALARAYEEGGQMEMARETLWRCVELEEARGVRPWGVAGVGGYVL